MAKAKSKLVENLMDEHYASNPDPWGLPSQDPYYETQSREKELKPGWKSSEFYLSAAAVVLGALASSGLLVDGSTEFKVVGLLSSVLGALGYAYVRSQLKKG